MRNINNYSKLSEQLSTLHTPIIKLQNILLPIAQTNKQINQSIVKSLLPFIDSTNKIIEENQKTLSRLANVSYQVDTNLLLKSQKTIDKLTKCLNFNITDKEFNCDDLIDSANFVLSKIDTADKNKIHKEEVNIINNIINNTDTESDDKKYDYATLLTIIIAIASLLVSIMSYCKDDPYEKGIYTTIQSIDKKLDELIELESGK